MDFLNKTTSRPNKIQCGFLCLATMDILTQGPNFDGKSSHCPLLGLAGLILRRTNPVILWIFSCRGGVWQNKKISFLLIWILIIFCRRGSKKIPYSNLRNRLSLFFEYWQVLMGIRFFTSNRQEHGDLSKQFTCVLAALLYTITIKQLDLSNTFESKITVFINTSF